MLLDDQKLQPNSYVIKLYCTLTTQTDQLLTFRKNVVERLSQLGRSVHISLRSEGLSLFHRRTYGEARKHRRCNSSCNAFRIKSRKMHYFGDHFQSIAI